jgi:hypothetical protein
VPLLPTLGLLVGSTVPRARPSTRTVCPLRHVDKSSSRPKIVSLRRHFDVGERASIAVILHGAVDMRPRRFLVQARRALRTRASMPEVRLTNGTRSARTGSNRAAPAAGGREGMARAQTLATNDMPRRPRRRTSLWTAIARHALDARDAPDEMCPTLWMTAWRRLLLVVSVPRHRCLP